MRLANKSLPPGLQRFMPLVGQAALKKIASDSTLFLETEKQNYKFPCQIFASYFLHAAQDGGFSKICVLKGATHKHEFKVIDLVKYQARRFGGKRAWSGPSLVSFKIRKDCWIDERKKIWVMGWKPKPDAKVISARV